jgi:hypothetical protein
MKNGHHIIFVLQFRTVSKSPADARAKKDDKWYGCGDDYWGRSTNPYIGSGNTWRPRNRAASEDFRAAFHNTGQHGWSHLPFAVAALKRVRKDDAAGMYNYKDPSNGRDIQTVRHEFRLVKLEVTYNLSDQPIDMEDLVEAMK